MATPANLDAFLPREDFYASEAHETSEQNLREIGLGDLQDFYPTLIRKPDFQRTTAAWDPKRIAQFIKSFATGDLIPGVIFWNSPTTGRILVIDGAHRISALLAWIHDDYGDGDVSRKFLGYYQNKEQGDAADATRRLVNRQVGQFNQVWAANAHENALPEHRAMSMKMRKKRLPVQWIHGDAGVVTESFFRINLSSVALDKTEERLIRDRLKPNAIATRAIVQFGGGHQYWKDFHERDAKETVSTAKEVHELLFSPQLPSSTITTIHLPIGGKAYAGSAMEVTLGLVEFANRKPDVGAPGPVTATTLQKTWRLLSKINGKDASCLGLHPAVYFYSHSTGKHQPAALMAVVEWIDSMTGSQIEDFISVRKLFEDFLVENATMLGDTISRRGSRGRSVPTLTDYYKLLISELLKGSSHADIYKAMSSNRRLAPFAMKLPDLVEYGSRSSPETKSYIFITDALKSSPTCKICGARYHPDSVNADHDIPRSKGGTGAPANLRPTHYYCNANRARIEPLISSRNPPKE